jgi:WD40 repeat protein
MSKRVGNDHLDDESLQPQSKRSKNALEAALVPRSNTELVSVNYNNSSLVVREKIRASSLPAPELTFIGHEAAVYTIAFDPTGEHLCSAGMDRNICKHF